MICLRPYYLKIILTHTTQTNKNKMNPIDFDLKNDHFNNTKQNKLYHTSDTKQKIQKIKTITTKLSKTRETYEQFIFGTRLINNSIESDNVFINDLQKETVDNGVFESLQKYDEEIKALKETLSILQADLHRNILIYKNE